MMGGSGEEREWGGDNGGGRWGGHHEKETCFPYWCELPHAWGWGGSDEGRSSFPVWLQPGPRLCLLSSPSLSPARATPVLPPVHLALATRAPAARGPPARPPGRQAVSFWMVLL